MTDEDTVSVVDSEATGESKNKDDPFENNYRNFSEKVDDLMEDINASRYKDVEYVKYSTPDLEQYGDDDNSDS